MKWNELIKLEFKDGGLNFQAGPVFLILIIALVAIYLFYIIRKYGCKFWERFDVVVGCIPGLGQVEIRPNHETINIAYKAWIELKTRKAALPFDDQHDLVYEIYSSWYVLFDRLRDLAKNIPAQRLRYDKNTRELVRIMLQVLNDGLRPHLTEWQAKFRTWYEAEVTKPENIGISPQEVQRRYPEFDVILKDLKKVNAIILAYSNWLRRVAEGDTSENLAEQRACEQLPLNEHGDV